MSRGQDPPVKYLRECSDNSLRHFEVTNLEHVANLRRELSALWEEMIEESALALLARWMIENRCALRSRVPVMALAHPTEAFPLGGFPGEFGDPTPPRQPDALITELLSAQPRRQVLLNNQALRHGRGRGNRTQHRKAHLPASNGTKHAASPFRKDPPSGLIPEPAPDPRRFPS